MPVRAKPPHLVAVGTGDFPGTDLLVPGGVPLFQEFGLFIDHPPFGRLLQAAAVRAAHAPHPVVNRGRQSMALFAEPPDFPAGPGGHILRAQGAVSGRVPLPGQIGPQDFQIVGIR